MRSLLADVAKYWKTWNRVYTRQVHHEDESYPVEQVGSERRFGALRGQSSEAGPLYKTTAERGISSVQPELHQPL